MPEDQPKVIDPKLVEELKARGWTDAGIEMFWTSQLRSLDPRVIEKLKAHGMTDEEIKINYTYGPRMYTNSALVNMQEALQEVIIEDQGSIINKLKHSNWQNWAIIIIALATFSVSFVSVAVALHWL